jgi:hypothetical protein
MKPQRHIFKASSEDHLGPASPYDRAETEDLWFLPEADADDALAPLPRADRQPLFDPAEWGRAQADLAAELAALCLNFGAFEERLAGMGQGTRQRLAILEAAELSWWAGHRIGAERLTLWVGSRTGGGEDNLALVQAGWAVRRLMAGQGPAKGGWADGIAGFLGHAPTDATAELAEVMDSAHYLHPVTQSAILFHAWRIAGTGAPRDTEAAVMAACHGGTMGRRPGQFLPLALAGMKALRAAGSAHARLSAWISGAEAAVLSALMQLDRLTAWQGAARTAIANLSGRTPDLLIDLFAQWPMVSAPMAEARIGASRAAVQRNLQTLTDLHLIRETTGQGRYRLWAAKI